MYNILQKKCVSFKASISCIKPTCLFLYSLQFKKNTKCIDMSIFYNAWDSSNSIILRHTRIITGLAKSVSNQTLLADVRAVYKREL
jgi:hypothetical protein